MCKRLDAGAGERQKVQVSAAQIRNSRTYRRALSIDLVATGLPFLHALAGLVACASL